MSGGSKQQFKQFTINSIKDACLALGMLISGVVVNLEKYKEESNQIKKDYGDSYTMTIGWGDD